MAERRRTAHLADTADTVRLGAAVAAVLAHADGPVVLLLRGDLGSGKTTFVRGLVEAAPGGNEAEVASPSFNLVNIYPTRPEVVHMDLYRLRGDEARELFEEYADQALPYAADDPAARRVIAVEWAENLPDDCLARDHLGIFLRHAPGGRTAQLTGAGPGGEALLARLAPHLAAFPGGAGPHEEAFPGPPGAARHHGGTMRIMVQKYGGTSVAGLDRMKQVQARVQKGLDEGFKVVVVLSAMSGETNRLLGLARQFSATPDLSECDSLVTTGEQVSVALFAMLLKDAGIKCRSVLGHQIPILTNNNYARARILEIDKARLMDMIEEFDVLVVAGFQGVSCHGRLTTLGRGGSDTTGVALAAALEADVCEIYTDVKGVYTTDPNMCSTARKLDRISYDEMLEFSSMGAKVLQIRSVEFAKKYNVPVRVRSTFCDDPGTLVTQEDEQMEDVLVSGIAYDKDQCRITVFNVMDSPGVAAAIFSPIADAGILVDMIVQNTSRDGRTDMTFTISRVNLEKTLEILGRANTELGAVEVQHDLNVCKVSVIGVGMRNHSGVAAMMFTCLRNDNINILMISTSEIKITCLIEEKYLELAVRALHDAFGLDRPGGDRVC